MSGLTDEQLARLRCVAGQYGRLQIRLGGPHGAETRPVIPRDDIVAALAERDALRAECERWKAAAREASQSVIWYSERVEWLLSATDIDPHQEGEAIMQALHDRLAEQDALRERVARLEAIETAARALYQAQVEGGWPNDQDAEHDALGVALGEQEVSASDATE